MSPSKLYSTALRSLLLAVSFAPLFGVTSSVTAECAPGSTCPSTSQPNCNLHSRVPFNLETDTQTPHKVKLSWAVCQKNDFYQVGWNRSGGADTIVKVDGSTALSWTLPRVRDEIKYTFKVRGCSNRPNAEPDCTSWAEMSITTPDWD